MGLTAFPNGITSMGLPIVGGRYITSGDIHFVDSATGSNATDRGGDTDHAFADVDYSVAQCTASKSDFVFVMPGHAETLGADSAVDIDVVGITYVGLGNGTNRPTFTFDTGVTADFKLAAANTTISNLLFIAGVDALTGPIEVTAAECQIINCEYRDDDTNNYETVDVIITSTAAHYLLVDGFKFRHDAGSGGTQCQSVINLVSADYAEIRNCLLIGDHQKGCIEDATASKMISIHDNYIETSHADDIAITLAATTTGFVFRNFLKIATNGQTTWITATNDCALFENYGVNNDAETGMLLGTVST